MFKQWISQHSNLFVKVHRATTREELEAVYRFRYEVYHEEFGRELGAPDHERRWVTDAADEADYTTILYTGTPDNITGTMRLHHWRAGEVPEVHFDELSMDVIPGVSNLNTGELGRFMIRRSRRGSLILASLVRESFEILAAEHDTHVSFCYCSPGLVGLYKRMSLQPFGGRLINAPDGMMVPLACIMCDAETHERLGSFLAPIVPRYYGPDKMLDLDAYRPLFEGDATGVEHEPERVRELVDAAFSQERSSFLDSLPRGAAERLVQRAMIIDVPDGTLVTRKNFVEKELYVVLDGTFEANDDGTLLRRLSQGDLFGEDAYFHPEGRRMASVEAKGTGRVLVLRGKTVQQLIERKPVLAPLLRQLGSVMSGQLTVESREPALA